jgi:hypothetical protein
LRRRTARSGLDIVMVNIWESVGAAAEARQFAAVWGLEGTILLDEPGQYAAQLGIRGVPFNLAVDSAGLVRAAGLTTPRELQQAADMLLAGH